MSIRASRGPRPCKSPGSTSPRRSAPIRNATTQIQRQILDGIAAIPGVEAASFGFGAPMEAGRTPADPLYVEGQRYEAGETAPIRRFQYVAPGYFATVGTRMVAGRDITWPDIDAGGKVAVISEGLARELWGEPAAALGKRVRESRPDAPGIWRDVIGVVRDVHEDGVEPGRAAARLLAGADGELLRAAENRHAGDRLRRAQRARGHGELRRRDQPSRVGGERRSARVSRAYGAGSVRRLPRADVVHARDARDRRCDGARTWESSASTA